MNELETLLNSLIQMGWKPFGKKYTHLNYGPKRKYRHIMFGGVDLAVFSYSLRQLVSLESGLWQFVVNKRLYRHDQHTDFYWTKTVEDNWDSEIIERHSFPEHHYHHRLLESALIPEEELAKFLVDNIVLGKN